MLWAAVSRFSAGPIITLEGRIPDEMYREILADQVHSTMQTLFPAGDENFQEDNALIHTVGLVQSWFDEHGDEVKYLPLRAQSPGLNYIEVGRQYNRRYGLF
ncbi:DDE_3 domain-containing protein [Trichonephila clavipes]|nr:DDE_3 domain-containing protein [Trichonephila clavipes]